MDTRTILVPGTRTIPITGTGTVLVPGTGIILVPVTGTVLVPGTRNCSGFSNASTFPFCTDLTYTMLKPHITKHITP